MPGTQPKGIERRWIRVKYQKDWDSVSKEARKAKLTTSEYLFGLHWASLDKRTYQQTNPDEVCVRCLKVNSRCKC